ncbi:MAG: GNAT family N-acetyltransferase [Stomatobaculum sp.]|nr:GNAT family N-acetyltransferase [Stomatobaculum sp.]
MMAGEKEAAAAGTYMVRRLSQTEKLLTRPLYEEAFPEDGPELTDFYYDKKMAGNVVFAALDRTGHASGMLCLNPYRVMIRGKEFPLSYIVAVATERERRRKGIMRSVLTEALLFLRSRSAALREQQLPGVPFTFLKPADPAYYEPFGFAYISRRIRRALKKDVPCTRKVLKDAGDAAVFMNSFLAEHYEAYCFRDDRYMRDLLCELEAGKGRMELLIDNTGAEANAGAEASAGQRIIGTAAWDYPEAPEHMGRILAGEEYLLPAEGPAEPFMMARIVDLPEFLGMLSEKRTDRNAAQKRKNSTPSFRFAFEDPLIPENQGLWEIRLGEAGLAVTRLNGEGAEMTDMPAGTPVFTPEQMTQLLFGYRAPEEGTAEEVLLRFLPPLRGVYFDEET